MAYYDYLAEPDDDEEELPDVIQPESDVVPICGLCFAERL